MKRTAPSDQASFHRTSSSATRRGLFRAKGTSTPSLHLFITFALVIACFLALGSGTAFAAGDANTAICPTSTEESPGFRSTLPDCRAYEMVTPAYQNGTAARWNEYQPTLISEDGEHLLGLDIGGFAGTENDEQVPSTQTGAIYEFSRTSTGWQTEPLDPPAQISPRNSEFLTASTDLQQSLWSLPVPSPPGQELLEPRGYEYAIRTGTGSGASFVRVGPSNTPTAPQKYNELFFGGTSSDLRHVVFSIFPEEAQQEWPGDTTHAGARSLYEYVGTGNAEPRLVGVRNAGPLSGSSHVNEHADLISNCGTSLGTEGGSAYNAVSGDGETVFFTASACEGAPSVQEVYARVGGARTVAISEPTLGVSGDCEECDESAPAEAIFQGASRDGSKAFFLSTQSGLLPGAQGQNLYEYDFSAPAHHRLVRVGGSVTEPKVLGVMRISEDGSRVYFVAEGQLASRNPAGGEPQADAPNLYEFNSATGAVTFVATLAPADASDWSIIDNRPAQATSDGMWLVFASRALLTPDDESTEAAPQLFEFNASDQTLVRVSVGQAGSYLCPTTGQVQNGFACDGNATTEEDAPKIPVPGLFGRSLPVTSGLAVSQSGAVFFTSLNALTPEATHGGRNFEETVIRENVYEYADGNVYLLSPPVEPAPLPTLQSHLLGIDPSGSNAFLFTTSSLVGDDTDTQASWYDAHLGGGFPAPVSPSKCFGEGCQGALSRHQAESTPASATFAGPGNGKKKPKKHSHRRQMTKVHKVCHARMGPRERRKCERNARHRRNGASNSAIATSLKGVGR